MPAQLTNEKFIEKCKKYHGDKFTYDKVNYIGNLSKVIITCREHGDFEILPKIFAKFRNDGLTNHGCKLCYRQSRITKDLEKHKQLFLSKCNEKHNDKFIYHIDTYINNSTNMLITCKIHGDFSQTPLNHLNSPIGCYKCQKDIERKPISILIEQFNLLHNNKYDYSKLIYKSSYDIITVICRTHGEFNTTPKQHLKSGCKECYDDVRGNSLRFTNEEFINKSISVHGNLYTYNKLNYINSKTNVIITCKKHGDFEVNPYFHISKKRGCYCKYTRVKSIGELNIKNILDSNNIKYKQQYSTDECRNKRPLKFDFYLIDLNILLEYDGVQHFKPISGFGGNKSFNYQMINDNIKNTYCLNNNIKLIRIKYTDDIKSILVNESIINNFN